MFGIFVYARFYMHACVVLFGSVSYRIYGQEVQVLECRSGPLRRSRKKASSFDKYFTQEAELKITR